jgi:hypothetical protein
LLEEALQERTGRLSHFTRDRHQDDRIVEERSSLSEKNHSPVYFEMQAENDHIEQKCSIL